MFTDHEEDTIVKTLQGQIVDLPVQSSGVVKIFVCSTQSDFHYERCILWETVLPDLQQYCSQHGLEVELVDPLHGTNVDPCYDTKLYDLCMQELEDCHRISQGPFFLCLIGNKYGPTPLPACIEAEEFEKISEEAFRAGKDIHLLTSWYAKDDSGSPSVYRLCDPREKLKYYDCRNPEMQGLKERDVSEWLQTSKQLQNILQTSVKEGVIDMGQDKYFTGSVDQLVRRALELSPKRCIAIQRHLEGIIVDDEASSQFSDINLLDNEMEEDQQNKLVHLQSIIDGTLREKNRHKFSLPWDKKGLDFDHPDHSYYLSNIGTEISDLLENSIFENLPNRSFLITGNPYCSEKVKLYQEVLVHMEFFAKKGDCKLYGCHDTLSQIQQLLSTGSREDHYPIFITGPVGCGKTSILARIPSMLRDMCSIDVFSVMRSIGLTTRTVTPKALLLSVCLQLQHLLGMKLKLEEQCDDEQSLLECYRYLIQTLSQGHRQWVILLDGIELLKPHTPTCNVIVDWLLSILPHRVHIVVSYASTETSEEKLAHINHLERHICKKVPIPVAVPPLDEDDILLLLKEQFSTPPKIRSMERKKMLHKILAQSGNPLLAWTLCEVEKHKSFPYCSAQNSMKTTLTPRSTFTSTLDMLEDEYSFAVVQTVVTHITLSVSGVTEVQLLDILSCNDEILFWCFPRDIPTVLRFPHLLWTAIRTCLEPFLCRRHVDNKSLFTWRHAVYATIIKERYLQTIESIRKTHCNLAMSLMDTSGEERPLVNTSRGVHMEYGNRLTFHQPLVLNESRYNMRKLNELWIYLLYSGDIDEFKEHTFCNFEYLMAKLHILGIHHLLCNLKTSLSHLLDAELYLVWRCLTKASEILSKDFLQLPSELIGRLRKIKDKYTYHTSSLVMQCMQWCDNFDLPLLVPLTPWLADPRSPLVTKVDCPEGAGLVAITKNGQHAFYTTNTNSIQMRHLASRKKIREFNGHSLPLTCLCISHDNKFLVSASHDGNVHIWNIGTGDCTDTYRPHNDAVLCLALSSRDDLLVTGGKDGAVHVISLIDGAVIFTKCHHTGPVTCVCLNASNTILV